MKERKLSKPVVYCYSHRANECRWVYINPLERGAVVGGANDYFIQLILRFDDQVYERKERSFPLKVEPEAITKGDFNWQKCWLPCMSSITSLWQLAPYK